MLDDDQRLHAIADDLIGIESGRQLLLGLERRLGEAGALPARLYLLDESAEVLYLGARLEAAEGPDELPLQTIYDPPPGAYPLMRHGDPIGLLVIDAPQHAVATLRLIAVLLGPALQGVQQNELTLGELRQLHEQRQQLFSAGSLLKHLDIEALLVHMLETVLTAVHAQVGAILVAGADEQLETRVTWGIQERHVDALRLRDGGRLVDAVFESRMLRCYDAEQIAAELDVSMLDAQLDGLLLLPMTSSERCHGVALLANPAEEFDAALRRLGEVVCDMGAIALDNARLVQATVDRERLHRELEIATKVQANMFPAEGLRYDDLRIEGSSDPCDETGGDYFTFLAHDKRVFAVIADVTGHGLGAALYTTMAHAVIQQRLRTGDAIQLSAAALSSALRYSNSERFMTAVILEIDPAARSFHYVSAGHNPLLLLPCRGEASWLDSNGLPLGIMPDVEYEISPAFHYQPGDYLILYTDGFTEACNSEHEQFGEDRLAACLQPLAAQGAEPQVLIRELMDTVRGWMGTAAQSDDLTVVVLRL